LIDTIRENPMPASVAAIGIGWLWMSARRHAAERERRLHWRRAYEVAPGYAPGYPAPPYPYGSTAAYAPTYPAAAAAGYAARTEERSTGAGVGQAIQEGKRRVGEAVDNLQERAGDVVETVQDRAGAVVNRVQERASDVVDTVQE